MDNLTATIQNGTQSVSNTYSLSGTLCTPIGGVKDPSLVQFLIHGVGFDSRFAFAKFSLSVTDTIVILVIGIFHPTVPMSSAMSAPQRTQVILPSDMIVSARGYLSILRMLISTSVGNPLLDTRSYLRLLLLAWSKLQPIWQSLHSLPQCFVAGK
jgi:hypothetical protein